MSDPYVGQAVGAGKMISHSGGQPNFDYSGNVNSFNLAAVGVGAQGGMAMTSSPSMGMKLGL